MRPRQAEDGSFDPIESLISEALLALNAQLYTVALISAMVLVDMCGALDSPDGESKGVRFKAWYRANLPPSVTALPEDDAWRLRCGLLHQGHFRGQVYARLVFMLPNDKGIKIESAAVTGPDPTAQPGLALDYRMFVLDVLRAVGIWWVTNKTREPVATNAKELARVRPNGMSPYGGLPLIA